MRKRKPQPGSNERVRSGVLYFLCLLVLLELIRQAATYYHNSNYPYAGPDTIREATWDSMRAAGLNRRIPGDVPGDSGSLGQGRRGTSFRDRPVGSRPSDNRTSKARPSGGAQTYPTPAGPPTGDLNTADAGQLQSVSGIGPVLSARIVKFRDALGGFLNASQLYDVYGLSPEVADRVMTRFRIVDVPPVRKVDVNTATAGELAALVYLDWEMAQALVAHREQYGPFADLSDIGRVQGIPAARIERIALYLTLGNE